MNCTECGTKCKVTDRCVGRTFYECPSCCNEFDRPEKAKRGLSLTDRHVQCLRDIESLGMPQRAGVEKELADLEKAGFVDFRLFWELTANGQAALLLQNTLERANAVVVAGGAL